MGFLKNLFGGKPKLPKEEQQAEARHLWQQAAAANDESAMRSAVGKMTLADINEEAIQSLEYMIPRFPANRKQYEGDLGLKHFAKQPERAIQHYATAYNLGDEYHESNILELCEYMAKITDDPKARVTCMLRYFAECPGAKSHADARKTTEKLLEAVDDDGFVMQARQQMDAAQVKPERASCMQTNAVAENGADQDNSADQLAVQALLARIEALKTETRSTDAEIADALRDIMEGRPAPAKFTHHPEYRAVLDAMLERITATEAQFASRMARQVCEEAGLSAPELARILRGMFQNESLPDRLARNPSHSTVLNSLFQLLQAAAFNPAYPMACAMIPMMLDTIEGGGAASFDDLIEYAVDAKNTGFEADENLAGRAARN